ncbi:MAG: metalloregulator ArsR/SmtB family transcription factor [Lachnospiraceae bacterium]|nr:metalloregulator ArsR/SmtB family transcription factor [Lachnospiraceae bacterium]
MLYFKTLDEAEEVFKALSAPMRLRIMELITQNENMSMNDLAETLELTNSAISMHVSKLESAGLVAVQTTSGKRGIMKVVRPMHERLIVDMSGGAERSTRNCYTDDIAIGHYTKVEVHPTCGLSTSGNLIGDLDNPKVFSYPERFKADILWIGHGYVTYNMPNRLRPGQSLTEIQISFEICSECPEFNDDYPSDIYFDINGHSLGKWISPGDFGNRRGMLAPNWWPDALNQYGLLKTIIINNAGTFMDGTHKLSSTTIEDLGIDYNSDINFTFSVPEDTANCGGLTLFGESFGDYSQNIQVKLYYEENK